jgi:hypothetical protein
MSRALEPVSRAGRVLFELDRFELVDDRYELEGRWSGVRGRRFIRPTLTVVVDGHPARLLADLAHKPWAAEDGEPWQAAFPARLQDAEIEEAELSVAPDITVVLAGPGSPSFAPAARPADPRPTSAPCRRAEPEQEGGVSLSEALAESRARRRRLQSQLDDARAQRAQTAARMDELLGKLSQAIRERDEIAAGREALLRDREEAVRASEAAADARDDALAQRGGAIVARTQAESARDEALAARAQAETERDAALALRDHALADRDAALVARDDAAAERQAALSARDDALRDRDSLRSALEQHQSQRAHEASARGAAMVMRRAIQEPPAFRAQAHVLPRALAIIVLLAIVVALLIVLRVA